MVAWKQAGEGAGRPGGVAPVWTPLALEIAEQVASEVSWDARGLVPAVAQDRHSGRVLMLAWMNREALVLTLTTGEVTYWSRSRQGLWRKGATSGHRQHLAAARLDCDGDTLLLEVEQEGPACHTGRRSCFFTPIGAQGLAAPDEAPISD